MPAEVTLGEIADFVGGTYAGRRDLIVRGVAPLVSATEHSISFLSNPKYASQLDGTGAAAVLVARNLPGDSSRFIRVDNPYVAMAMVLTRWFAARPRPVGISELASIASTARLGRDVVVGPFVTIGADVVIGDGCTIYQNVSIEAETTIGDGCTIYPNVSIYNATQIGARCIIHSGVVIGADGFGFATAEGVHHKIPQVGIVRIEDDVEIGANSTIDRAALGETVIGAGTKMDNMVMIAHNVKVGKRALFAAQSGIAGSTEIGDDAMFAGQSGSVGHIRLGNRVIAQAKTGITKDWPDGTSLVGFPAIEAADFNRQQAALRRLPDLLKRVNALEKKLNEQEK